MVSVAATGTGLMTETDVVLAPPLMVTAPAVFALVAVAPVVTLAAAVNDCVAVMVVPPEIVIELACVACAPTVEDTLTVPFGCCEVVVALPTVKAPPVVTPVAFNVTLLPPVNVTEVAATAAVFNVVLVVAAELTVVLFVPVPESETFNVVKPVQPWLPAAVELVLTVNVSPDEMVAL